MTAEPLMPELKNAIPARALIHSGRARRRLAVCVEVLEPRALLSSAASIQWEMAPQIAPDPNHGAQPDLPNTSAYVNPPNGYEVLLDASHSRGIGPLSSFNWTISQSSKVVTTVQGEKPDVDLPEGTYTVQLTANNLRGTTGPAVVSTSVVVKDILIVSIGDSYASGEGNPVVPGYFGFESAQWAYSPDASMELQNANAHRSTVAAPAQFALALQKSNPHEAVTFVSVANSGASIAQGLLGPMPSIGDPSYILPAELDELKQIIGSHPISVLTLSIGANDIGFSTRVDQLIENTELGSPSLSTIQSQVNADLATLPQQYAMLDQAIKVLDPGQILITGYPDLTRNSQGKIAPIVFLGLDIISAKDAKFAANSIIAPLDQAVGTAARTYGWTYVDYSADFRRHGYPSTNSWIRDLNDSEEIEDSFDGAFHPNAAGHRDIAKRLLQAYENLTRKAR
jgi:lysophospholipase L1-like esterase